MSCAVKQFANKVVLITGAGSGIGASTAQLFAREGAKLSIADMDMNCLKEVGKKCSEEGCKPLEMECDVTNDTDLCNMVKCTIQKQGKLDILINNAGIFFFDHTESTTIDCFQKTLDTNIRSVVNLSIYAVPHLIKTKGSIVNVSSVCGLRAFPYCLSYCVSKSALDQFTRCAALDLAPKGVRINAVNPGVVSTNLLDNTGMSAKEIEEYLNRVKTLHPLGRIGEPEEIAKSIMFLASPRADWITGALLSVDGGWQVLCPI